MRPAQKPKKAPPTLGAMRQMDPIVGGGEEDPSTPGIEVGRSSGRQRPGGVILESTSPTR
jgi:hypothetical protein